MVTSPQLSKESGGQFYGSIRSPASSRKNYVLLGMAHSVVWRIGASEYCQVLIHGNELNEAESLRSQRDMLRHLRGVGDPGPCLDREEFSSVIEAGR